MIYKLIPILKHRVWGGYQLPKIFNVNTNDTIGEAWILSCINNDNNLINNSLTLKDLFLKNKDIVKKGWKGDFPILIKLIDAREDLSIQVHPSIKTEFWYILNKTPSKLYMGLKNDSNRHEVENALKQSNITSLINHVDVKNGDSYLIKPGTIHAICKGTFLIEIQQSADVTYRLYDYNRIDSNGKTRPLHINESLDCLDYHKFNVVQHNQSEHLVSCPFFNVYKKEIKGQCELNADQSSFNAITVVDGNVEIITPQQTLKLSCFETAFIPAGEGKYTIKGNGTIILTTL